MPLVRLYSAEDSIEAHLLRHMLERQGIPCVITGEHLESGMGELPAFGVIDVWVLDENFADADEVLEDFFDTLDGVDEFGNPLPGLEDEEGDDGQDAAPDAGEEPARPAHDDPDNPWNRVYRKR